MIKRPDDLTLIGGPYWGDNECPKCGKKERRFYLYRKTFNNYGDK